MKSSVPFVHPFVFNVTIYSVKKEFYTSVLMAIGPCDSRNAGIITIIAAIVIMTVPVEGQTLKCPPSESANLCHNNWILDYQFTFYFR